MDKPTAKKLINFANSQAKAARLLAVEIAKEADVCRICLKAPEIPVVLHFGAEYACRRCLDRRREVL